jgi:hypothetical protein
MVNAEKEKCLDTQIQTYVSGLADSYIYGPGRIYLINEAAFGFDLDLDWFLEWGGLQDWERRGAMFKKHLTP